MAEVSFESPISSTPAPGLRVTLADESAMTKLSVRSDGIPFDISFGTSEVIGAALVCGIRPGEWLVLGSPDPAAAVAGAVSGGFTNVIDITHGRAAIRITGPAAPLVLEKVCSLDWSDPMTPDGAVTSASVAKVTCDIVRSDTGGDRSYLLLVDRSLGQYLVAALTDAAAEFD